MEERSTTPDDIARFVDELRRQDVAHKTLVNYRSDLLQVACWFEGSRGEPFTAVAVTSTDLRQPSAGRPPQILRLGEGGWADCRPANRCRAWSGGEPTITQVA